MAYEGGMGYQLHMPSYFWRTFTEYPFFSGYMFSEIVVFAAQSLSMQNYPKLNIIGYFIQLHPPMF